MNGKTVTVVILSVLLVISIIVAAYLWRVPYKNVSTQLRMADAKIQTLTTQIQQLTQQPKAEQPVAEPKKELVGTIYFYSGDIQLTSSGLKTLHEIQAVLQEDQTQAISVEGHADNIVLGDYLRKTYASNLELSAARAIHTAKFMERRLKIAPERIQVSCFSKYKPIADNSVQSERKRNRRVEIYLLPEE